MAVFTGAGYENFPDVLVPAFQQNMLDREFQDQLEANCVIRRAAYRKPQPNRSGEVMIFTRAGELVPVVDDVDPTLNTGVDNGLGTLGGVGAANPTYPIEQFAMKIGMTPYALQLNVYQDKLTLASFFKQNIKNLGKQAGLSLDLKGIGPLLQAYESGRTWATAASGTSGSNTTVAVDNGLGFDSAFPTVTIAGNVFPYGRPAGVSVSNPVKATHIAAGSGVATPVVIIGFTPDGTNASTMLTPTLPGVGVSGVILIQGTPVVLAKGDILVAADAPAYYRPGTARSRYEMTATSTAAIQQIINAVAGFRLNGIEAPLPDGTFPCFIDSAMNAQFFTDSAFQILTQGEEQSATFKYGRVNRNFGVTFVETTNLPTYTFVNSAGKTLVARRALICADRFLQEGPFEGAAEVAAQMNGKGVTDVRTVDDIQMVHRLPIDYLGQIMTQAWFYIGGFCVPTDATITNAVIPSATPARYKRAAVVEVASTF